MVIVVVAVVVVVDVSVLDTMVQICIPFGLVRFCWPLLMLPSTSKLP